MHNFIAQDVVNIDVQILEQYERKQLLADHFLQFLQSVENHQTIEHIASLLRHLQVVELGLEVRLEVNDGFFAHQIDLTDAPLVLLSQPLRSLQSIQIWLIFYLFGLSCQFGFDEGFAVVAHGKLYEQEGPAGPLKEVLLRLLTIFLHRVANHRDVDISAFHDSHDVFLLEDLGAEHNRQECGADLAQLAFIHWAVKPTVRFLSVLLLAAIFSQIGQKILEIKVEDLITKAVRGIEQVELSHVGLDGLLIWLAERYWNVEAAV